MHTITYKAIQSWVKDTFGFVPKTCWIAHMKETLGIPRRVASNRLRIDLRSNPCPEGREAAILAAFVHFGLGKRN
jgi:hypothetical protein